MNPNQPNQTPLDPKTVANPLDAMREGEVIICTIKRHPIGLLSIYASFAMLLLIVGVVAIIAPDLLTDYDRASVYRIGVAVFLVALLFASIFSFIAQIVYYGNRWILTSDSLTQVARTSLFNKQTSQLSLGNLEDVTARQDGILANMFNYGTLRAETAGEHSKFTYPYCPNPNAFAQKILVARENFEQGQWYGEQRTDHRSGDNPVQST